jgi:hypothetical protein
VVYPYISIYIQDYPAGRNRDLIDGEGNPLWATAYGRPGKAVGGGMPSNPRTSLGTEEAKIIRNCSYQNSH